MMTCTELLVRGPSQPVDNGYNQVDHTMLNAARHKKRVKIQKQDSVLSYLTHGGRGGVRTKKNQKDFCSNKTKNLDVRRRNDFLSSQH